jgi:hypothetical protein
LGGTIQLRGDYVRLFNKIITTITLVLTIPLITLLLTFPEFSLMQAKLSIGYLEAQLDSLDSSNRLIMIAVAVGLDLVILGLLFANLRRPPRERAPIRLKKGGVAEVTFHAISQRIRANVGELSGVVEVIPYIEAPRRRVFITLDVAIDNHTNVPQTASEIVRIVQQTVGEDMGLAMAGKPAIHIRQTPLGSEGAPSGSNNPAAIESGPKPERAPRAVRPSPPRPPGRDAAPTRPMINEENFRG